MTFEQSVIRMTTSNKNDIFEKETVSTEKSSQQKKEKKDEILFFSDSVEIQYFNDSI
jgi:hypothetical protein